LLILAFQQSLVVSYVHRNDWLLGVRVVADYYRLTAALFVALSAIHRQCYRSEIIGGDHKMRGRAQVSFQRTKVPRHPQDLFTTMLVQKVVH
jgi:hypothetical protein